MAESRKIGMVSLGCPKALVDSERILTQLRTDGYQISPDYEGADVVIVNTCGFIDSAKAESLDAIGEALDANGRVIVTGCMGVNEDEIRAAAPTGACRDRSAAIRGRGQRNSSPRAATGRPRSLYQPGSAPGHQTDPKTLCIPENIRGLQP